MLGNTILFDLVAKYKSGIPVGIPAEKVLLGGDHLGPNPWRNAPSELAMHKAGVWWGF